MLEIHQLTVWYESLFGDIRALDRTALTVHPGTVTCLLGVNGAGKTTLFKTLSGVVKDDDGKVAQGRIRYQGKNLLGCAPRRIVSMGISHAPQDRHIFHTLSVEDNLLLGAYMRRKNRPARKTMERDVMAVFDLFPVLQARRRQKSGTLSGGEQQMLCMGRALMAEPSLLLLDEPFLGLAPKVIHEILNCLRQLRRDGLTILLAEQNAQAALSVADRGHVMEDGFIVETGPPEALWGSSGIRSVFFGGEDEVSTG
jgi:branched-chain amino acid transport system ATP-binding protein